MNLSKLKLRLEVNEDVYREEIVIRLWYDYCVVMMISYLSSQSINSEGESIVVQAKDARTEYSKSKDIDVFESDLKDMMQYVLRLGYVTNIEEQEKMFEKYQKLFVGIQELAKENGFYSLFEAGLIQLNESVEQIFTQKGSELVALSELASDSAAADGIRVQLEDFYITEEESLSKDDMNVVMFIQKLQQMKEVYRSLRQPDETKENEIRKTLLEAGLDELTLMEIGVLWDNEVLGGLRLLDFPC